MTNDQPDHQPAISIGADSETQPDREDYDLVWNSVRPDSTWYSVYSRVVYSVDNIMYNSVSCDVSDSVRNIVRTHVNNSEDNV